MKISQYILLSLKRKPIQSFVLVVSLTLTILFGLILTKFLLVSNERFKTLAREGQALIAAKSGEIDTLLSALNLESEKSNYIPFNLYQTLYSQTSRAFEDGQKIYTKINQVIPFLHYGLINNKYHVLGTNQDFLNRFTPDDSLKISEGRWVNSDDEVVIGKNIATKLSLHINDSIPITIENSGLTKYFKIVGLLNGKGRSWDNGAYTSIASGQNALNEAGLLTNSIWKTSILTHVLVYVSPDQYSSLKSLINDRTVSQLISIPETIIKLENLTMSGTSVTSLLVILVTTLGLCAIFGVIITRSEHTMNSLAILHSLGYKKFDILKITLFENIILWSISSFFALFFYALFFIWIQNNIVFLSYNNIDLWSNEFAYIILALGLGISLFSLIPLWILNKKGIHNILRLQ